MDSDRDVLLHIVLDQHVVVLIVLQLGLGTVHIFLHPLHCLANFDHFDQLEAVLVELHLHSTDPVVVLVETGRVHLACSEQLANLLLEVDVCRFAADHTRPQPILLLYHLLLLI